MPLTPDNFVNLRDGRFDATNRAQLDGLFTKCLAGPAKDNIVVHFHGGLVKEQDAMAMGERLLGEYGGASAYPVFFVWESGLVETLRNNAAEIAKEVIFRQLREKVAQFALGKLAQAVGLRGTTLEVPDVLDVRTELAKADAGDIPFEGRDVTLDETEELREIEARQFVQNLEADKVFQLEVQKITNSIVPPSTTTRGAGTTQSTTTLMSPTVLDDIRREVPAAPGVTRGLFTSARIVKGAVVILAKVISRFARKRDHGFHATIVEEIFREFYVSAVGQEIWGRMKKDTADAFGDNSQIFGGTAFLQRLGQAIAAGSRPRLTLVGHSAGSVYICNLLKHAGRFWPNDYQVDVILMAPAVTTELFASTVQRFGSRIRNIRMFTMADDREKQDRLIPVVYPHSLLYFISGVLEDESDKPILGMQRYYTGTASFYNDPDSGIPAAKTFFTGTPNRLILSVTSGAAAGLESDSVTHGGFDDTAPGLPRKTIDSVIHLLKNGF